MVPDKILGGYYNTWGAKPPQAPPPPISAYSSNTRKTSTKDMLKCKSISTYRINNYL